jgi:hypothetical protein
MGFKMVQEGRMTRGNTRDFEDSKTTLHYTVRLHPLHNILAKTHRNKTYVN